MLKKVQDKLHSIKLFIFFIFFPQFRPFDYSFAQMFMSCWTAVSCMELHGYLHIFHMDYMPDLLQLVIYQCHMDVDVEVSY